MTPKSLTAAAVLAAAAAAGCGQPVSAPARDHPTTPLTVAGWQAMTVADGKYDAETLDRLKTGDPKLQTPQGWKKFHDTVFAPSRAKDFPSETAVK